MPNLSSIGEEIAAQRKVLRLTQAALAGKAGVGHSTLDALENGRIGELGFCKVSRILAALGMELKLEPAALRRRPTLEELIDEGRDDPEDQGLDRRR